jgi:hypothetical protein
MNGLQVNLQRLSNNARGVIENTKPGLFSNKVLIGARHGDRQRLSFAKQFAYFLMPIDALQKENGSSPIPGLPPGRGPSKLIEAILE